MLGRCTLVFWIVGLALVAVPARAAAQSAAPIEHRVSAQVPLVARIVVEPSAQGPDGAPLVRLVSNDPTLRSQTLTPELVASGAFSLALEGGSTGGAKGLRTNLIAEPTVWRYTATAP